MEWPDTHGDLTIPADASEAYFWELDGEKARKRMQEDGEHQPQVGLLQRCPECHHAKILSGSQS